MMRILLSENVRRVENFFPISKNRRIMRLHIRGLFLYSPQRAERAREKSRRMSVSEQINNRFNESHVDKPGTRHGWRIYIYIHGREPKRKRRYLTWLETLKQRYVILFETKSSIAPRQIRIQYQIAKWIDYCYICSPPLYLDQIIF